MNAIEVNHNIEMGHRLSLQPESKCFHLHGHSWRVYLRIEGDLDDKGMVGGLNFADVKGPWRAWLDAYFDHHMLLNPKDPLAEYVEKEGILDWGVTLTDDCDPTVENVARIIGEWSAQTFFKEDKLGYAALRFSVKIFEAATNAAEWSDAPF